MGEIPSHGLNVVCCEGSVGATRCHSQVLWCVAAVGLCPSVKQKRENSRGQVLHVVSAHGVSRRIKSHFECRSPQVDSKSDWLGSKDILIIYLR